MPIYEYRCESCGHELDALQKLSDGPLQDCPGCQAPSLRRLISAPSFRLKGDGWYETDFKNKGKPTSDKDGEKVGSSDNEGEKTKKDADKKESAADGKKTDKADSKSTSTTGVDD